MADIGNGLVWTAHALEFAVEVDPAATFLTGNPFEGYVASGELVCSSLLSTGLGGGPVPDLVISVTVTEDTGSAEITGRIGPISRTRGSGGAGGASVTFFGVKVFARPNFAEWRLTYDTCEVRVFGVLAATLAAGEMFSYGTVIAPGYLPLLGMPVQISGTAQASCATGGTSPPTFESGAEVTATVSGGWRFKETSSGAWQSLPVTPYDNLSTPAGSLSLAGIVVSSGTYGSHVVAYAKTRQERQATGTCPFGGIPGPGEREDAAKSGRVWLVPNLSCAFERMDEPRHGALYIRSAFPWTQAQATALIQPLGSGFGTPFETIRDVHPSLPKVTFQAVAGAAPEETEVMDAARFSPIMVGASTSFASAALVDPCDDMLFPNTQTVSESVGVLFPFAVRSWTGSGPEAGELRNVDAIARYWQTWCHPHWSFAMPQIPWEVDGSPAPWTDYWGLIGSQHIDDPSIPDPARTRNHIISDLLETDNPWTGWQDAAAGGRRWPGITRWYTRQIVPRASFTYSAAQSELFLVTGGTLTHGPNLSLTVTGTEAEIRLDMDDYFTEPYTWPHIATHVLQDWLPAGIVSVEAFSEGQEGARSSIAADAELKGIRKELKRGVATSYAGAWGYDHGGGYIPDVGTDIRPGGISVASFSSPDRAQAFQLLTGRTRRRYVLKVTTSAPGITVDLNYPQFFHDPIGAPKVVTETRQCAAMLWPNAAGVRIGNLDQFTPTRGWLATPDVEPSPFRMSLVDGLGLARQLFQGQDKTLGTVEEAATIFDPYEPNNLGALESMSSAWMLPTQQLGTYAMALVWGPREVPPLASWPRRRRNTVTWLEDGSWTQRSYIWAQMGSLFAVPGNRPAHILPPPGDDTPITVSSGGAPLGWALSRFTGVLNNSEPDTYRVKYRGQIYARHRPWWGWLANLGTGSETDGDVHVTRLPLGQACAVIANEDGLTSRVFAGKGRVPYEASVSSETAITASQVARHPSGFILCVYAADGVVYESRTYTEGRSWRAPEVLPMTGTQVAVATDPESGYIFVATWESSEFRLWLRRTPTATWEDRGVIVTGDESRCGLEVLGDSANRLTFVMDGARTFFSTDFGDSWVEV